MTYEQAISYLESFINYERDGIFDYKASIKLERMRRFAQYAGDPQKGIPAVHVAGTKGKGSVSAFIQSVLIASGFTTGLYTSPHLFSFRERIRINTTIIDEDACRVLIEEMIPLVKEMQKSGERPTYFEMCTLLAFLYFRRQKVDYMILETGMGGRLDSTTICEPRVTVITPIGFDHMAHLGPGLDNIAREKAGIIKSRIPVVSSPQHPSVMTVIAEHATANGCPFYVTGRDAQWQILSSDLRKQVFRCITGGGGNYPRLSIHLLGDFQVENAVTALLAMETLAEYEETITADALAHGFKTARWPGRLEVAGYDPLIIVDGAQDANSAARLLRALRALAADKKLWLIIGAMSDKDIDGICRELCPAAHAIFTTRTACMRAASPEALAAHAARHSRKTIVNTASVKEACDKALLKAERDDLILCTGSLYLAGEALEYLRGRCTMEDGVYS